MAMTAEDSKSYVDPEWNPAYFKVSQRSSRSSVRASFEDVVISISGKDLSLCNRCAPMFSTLSNLRALASIAGYEHHNEAGLETATKLGCNFCAEILFKERGTYFDDGETPGARIKFFARREGTGDENFLHVPLIEEAFPEIEGYEAADYPFEKWKLAGIGCGTEDIGFNFMLKSVLADVNSAAAPFVERRPAVSDVQSQAVLLQARRWLDECLNEHPQCSRRRQLELPTRVIDVGDRENNRLHLHISEKGEVADYIALSYCWGGPQKFTTNKDSLNGNIKGFPAANLPKTIQDAIFITRSLGIRYIWIDAFCIIQDDDDDKAREIAVMSSIYKNSTVAISAAIASKVDEGFLGKQRSRNKVYEFPFLLPDGGLTKISVTGFNGGRETYEPLEKRAWCFQESMLSPRCLVFGSQELIWNCHTEYSKTISRSNAIYQSDMGRLPARIFNPDVPDASTDLERLRIWYSIVEDFTKRNITMPDDRLPAISGVLTELTMAWNDGHTYGMTQKTLLRQLSWTSVHLGSKPKTIIRSDRAPSWSWASTDGAIIFHELTNLDVELLGFEDFVAPTSESGRPCRDNRKLMLRAKILSMSNLPDDFLKRKERWISPDDGNWGAIGRDAIFAFLGRDEFQEELSLILKPRPDGLYERVGLFIDTPGAESKSLAYGISGSLTTVTPVRVDVV